MRVSIGILAWNEESTIAATIQSLLEQTLFATLRTEVERIEVVVVANGCRDHTCEAAEEGFRLRRPVSLPAEVVFRSVSIPVAGKSNAWNIFIHEVSDRYANYVILMDADIWFMEKETLWNMIRTLEADPKAYVSVGVLKKDIAFKERKSILDRMSLARSQLWESGPPVLCGQLYCGRTAALRRVWMPRVSFMRTIS